jgi:hypothetical protein
MPLLGFELLRALGFPHNWETVELVDFPTMAVSHQILRQTVELYGKLWFSPALRSALWVYI